MTSVNIYPTLCYFVVKKCERHVVVVVVVVVVPMLRLLIAHYF